MVPVVVINKVSQLSKICTMQNKHDLQETAFYGHKDFHFANCRWLKGLSLEIFQITYSPRTYCFRNYHFPLMYCESLHSSFNILPVVTWAIHLRHGAITRTLLLYCQLDLRSKLQWNFNRDSGTFTQENAFEYVACKIVAICSCASVLTHCGLVTPYGDRDLGQHWHR